jgi:outer membrane cobalamin receptor
MFLGFNNNPGYARVDTSASLSIFRGLSIYGRVANLADKKYQDALGFPALGREFRVGMKYTTHHE